MALGQGGRHQRVGRRDGLHGIGERGCSHDLRVVHGMCAGRDHEILRPILRQIRIYAAGADHDDSARLHGEEAAGDRCSGDACADSDDLRAHPEVPQDAIDSLAEMGAHAGEVWGVRCDEEKVGTMLALGHGRGENTRAGLMRVRRSAEGRLVVD